MNKHKFEHIEAESKPKVCCCCGAKATTWVNTTQGWCSKCAVEVLLSRPVEVEIA